MQTGAPVVLFDRYVPDLKTDYVIIDNQGSTYEAAKHLVNNGYKRIAFVTIETEQQQMMDRLLGYESAMSESFLDSSVLKITYQNSKDSIDKIGNFLKEDEYDAVIFAANYICMDGLRAFRKFGTNIFDDIAVVSFDDFELLEFCNPPITAIAQPLEAIAENIMKIMLLRLNEADIAGNKQIVLPAILNVRGSSERKVNQEIP